MRFKTENATYNQLNVEHALGEQTLHDIRTIEAVNAVHAEDALLHTEHFAALRGAKVAERVHVVGETIDEDRKTVPAVCAALLVKVKEVVSEK
jgi:hypothetical protein